MERPVEAALEQRESILNRVGVVQAFAVRNYVIDHAMAAKIEEMPDLFEHYGFVGLQQGFLVNVVPRA